MPTNPKPLSGEWLNAIKLKPNEFTAYVAKHPMKLQNVIIKNESISKSTIIGAEFINTVWDDSFAQNVTISDTVFREGDIYDTSFANSTLINVIFENMTLDKAEFINAKLINVSFKNCQIANSEFGNIRTSKIIFENSILKNVSFFEAELDLTLLNTQIIESGSFMSLKAGSIIHIKDSYIGPYSEFDSSTLKLFSVINSTIEEAKMNFATIDEVIIENSNLDFPMASGTFNNVYFKNIENSIILGRSTINSLTIEDCKKNLDLQLFRTVFKKISVRNCPVEEFNMNNAKGEKIQLSQMQVSDVNFSALTVKELILTDITIKDMANFEGAIAKESKSFNFKIKTGAKIKMMGTNINFQ